MNDETAFVNWKPDNEVYCVTVCESEVFRGSYTEVEEWLVHNGYAMDTNGLNIWRKKDGSEAN